MKTPRIVLAGTHSGVGKTTLTLGLLAAFRRRGIKVQPFKVGPDYIDPGLHEVAAGVTSHNLDSWMGSPEEVRELFIRRAKGMEISLVEGVMGLFDGARGQGERGSTAQVAKIIQGPVVLVFSAQGLARSAAALINGYRNFDPNLQVSGVIANGVGSERHGQFIKEVLEGELGIPLLGALVKQRDIVMPQRHLGLLPAAENQGLDQTLAALAQLVEEQIDMECLLNLAQQAPELTDCKILPAVQSFNGVRLAVARDEAFNFYYQDSLDYLVELGAELVFFSPLRDTKLPSDVDGIYIGGGFPEQFLPMLAANQLLKQEIVDRGQQSMPIYAECGGFMYLCESITNLAGQSFTGVGLVPSQVKMGQRLAALGYVQARLTKTSLLGEAGMVLKGHEFHWSTMEDLPAATNIYQLTGGRGEEGRGEGYASKQILASYVHLHFRYNPRAAHYFLTACQKYRTGRVNHARA
ncbi:cobyrinate a,c-diamide synthase [Desulforamulus reducens MI-1]|uniref:Cobyrinate a,c-diamide synthase n=1 Tax=Desulforamulus reducens (strain ATCC BAA-1160 / DSM 100696 / MI-1) TaxID=349161 RepID=A4J816_DESRM|nr:cobyrinate a,c-diamide synthase [Desulforamulus reducens]ABO51219.1 cobyrinate a,c-diamide synthase [Desulforamulus reducens MI-1]